MTKIDIDGFGWKYSTSISMDDANDLDGFGSRGHDLGDGAGWGDGVSSGNGWGNGNEGYSSGDGEGYGDGSSASER